MPASLRTGSDLTADGFAVAAAFEAGSSRQCPLGRFFQALLYPFKLLVYECTLLEEPPNLRKVHGGLLQHELAPILEAARKVGAAVLPIDRPQSAIRSRVAHRLWHPKLLQGLLSFAGFSLRKQRDALSPALPYDADEIRRELERCCPAAHDVLIDERSMYLAQQVAVSSVPDVDVAVVCSAPVSAHLASALRRVPDMQKAEDPQAGATMLLKLAKRGVPVWPLYLFAYGLVPAGLAIFAGVCFWDSFLYPALFQDTQEVSSNNAA